jgi:hypothetical protein
MVRARAIAILVAIPAAVLMTGSPSFGAGGDPDRIPWDQAKVTELAHQLSAAMTDIRQAALQDPQLRGARPGNVAQRAASQYLEQLRGLETSTRQLARRLDEGAGFDGTLNVARKIGTLLRDAQTSSRRLSITEPQLTKIEAAVAIIEQISPFYSSRSPLMPNPMQR